MRLDFGFLALCSFGLGLAGCGGGSGGGSPKPLERPVGDFIAFVSDGRLLGTNELFVSNADGTDVRCVSGATVPGADVIEFAWSPNRQLLAYTMDRDLNGPCEVYVIDPATMVQLTNASTSDPLATGFQDLQWDPTSRYVAARSATFQGGRLGVTVLRTDVPDVHFVAGPITSGGDVSSFKFQPGGGQRIAYLGDVDTDGRVELFTVNLDGTNRVKISEGGWPFSDVASDYAWSYNGVRLAYRGDLHVDGRTDLYTNGPLGGQQYTVSEVSGADRDVLRFAWRPTAMRLAFVHDAATQGFHELHIVSTNSQNLLHCSTLSNSMPINEFVWSPMGQDIAFTAASVADLFVSHDRTTDLDTKSVEQAYAIAELRWSPDGTHVFYVSELPPPSPTRLMVIRVADEQAISLGELDAGTSVADAQWSPDGRRILLRADGETPGVFSLYVASLDEVATTLVFDPGNAAHDVSWSAFAADGSTVAWISGTGFVASPWTDVHTALADGTDIVTLTGDLQPLSKAVGAALK